MGNLLSKRRQQRIDQEEGIKLDQTKFTHVGEAPIEPKL